MDGTRPPAFVIGGVLGLALLLSGGAALVFEMAWFHLAGLVFGNSLWATSLVLASFMGGLALGNFIASRRGDRIERPIRAYGLIELGIGASGLLLTLALPSLSGGLEPLLRGVRDSWAAQPVRFGLAFALLVVPTTLMGLTLPLVVAALCRRGVGFGPTLGILYGMNTLGAVAGVLLAETILVLHFGIRGAAAIAALTNVMAGVLALLLSRWRGGWQRLPLGAAALSQPAPGGATVMGTARVVRFLLAAFLFGGSLLALEVIWFRFLFLFVVNSSQALAFMLVVVLAGIGAGGFIGAGIVRSRLPVLPCLFVLALAAAATTVLTYRAFQGQLDDATRAAETTYAWYSLHYAWRTVVRYALALMLPGSVLSGALFTLVGHALKAEIGADARATGLLTLANTIGAMLGALAGAFVLLPWLGVERSFFAIALLYALAAALVAARRFWLPFGVRAIGLGIVVLAAAGVLATFPFGLMRDVFLPLVAKKYQVDGSKIIATRESPTESIIYMRADWLGEPVHYRLVTNGFSMSGTTNAAIRYMSLYAYWPAVVSGKPIRDALVISYGVGVTAGAVRDLPDVAHVDVVDTSRDIIEMSDLVYSEAEHPLRDPRVHTHIEDGRHFLLTADRRYDLITGEPPPPRLPGITSLYSREYFQLIHDRLNDGGVTTYWLPIHDLLAEDAKAIIRGFCDVFEDCSVWNGTPSDWMLVGFRGQPQPATADAFAAWWQQGLGLKLAAIGIDVPEQIGATFLGDAKYWKETTADTPPLTDNFPKRLRPLYAPPPNERARFFSAVVSTQRARAQFATSPFIATLWPAVLRQRTDACFESQQLVNVALGGVDPIGAIEHIHRLLTTGELPTLTLWLLGANVRQVAIAKHSSTPGERELVLAMAALAERRFAESAALFQQARDRGLGDRTTNCLHVYALCMAGDLEAARARAATLRALLRDNSLQPFWAWMKQTFGV